MRYFLEQVLIFSLLLFCLIELLQHAIEVGRLPLVSTAASMFRKLGYENKNALSADIIVGGWDATNGGQVYQCTIGGSLIRQPFCLGGSGSIYIYGYADANYRSDMTRDECVSFVRTALALAMRRDAASGGVIRTVAIDAAGVHRSMVPGDSIPLFFDPPTLSKP